MKPVTLTFSSRLVVVNEREAAELTAAGYEEGAHFHVSRPLPEVEVQPSTVRRMAEAARRALVPRRAS